MARSAPTRPTRKRTPSRRPASRPRSRASAASRSPLLHRDLRRELTGIGAIGAGVILAAVLILPGGGAIAGPVHDGLFGAFGAGAWIGVAGLLLTGARLCMTPEWRAGTLAALGSAVAMVALLGLIGMIGPANAGALGRSIGSGGGRGVGGAGGGGGRRACGHRGLGCNPGHRPPHRRGDPCTRPVVRRRRRGTAPRSSGEGVR